MKKSLILLIFALILPLALTSCKKEEKDETIPDGMVRLENAGGDYTLCHLEEWIIDRNDGMLMLHFSETDASSISVSAFAPPRDSVTSLPEYLEGDYKNHILSTLPTAEFDDEGFAQASVSGRDARRVEFEATVAEKNYRFMQTITLGPDGYIYIFTYTSTPAIFDSHLEDVEKVLETFSFN